MVSGFGPIEYGLKTTAGRSSRRRTRAACRRNLGLRPSPAPRNARAAGTRTARHPSARRGGGRADVHAVAAWQTVWVKTAAEYLHAVMPLLQCSADAVGVEAIVAAGPMSAVPGSGLLTRVQTAPPEPLFGLSCEIRAARHLASRPCSVLPQGADVSNRLGCTGARRAGRGWTPFHT
jgi:hypothetical protein